MKRSKKNYAIVNQMFGDIVKVTPSSKVVGDMAVFMTTNDYTREDIMVKGNEIISDSVKVYSGASEQPYGGFPESYQKMVLKGRTLHRSPQCHDGTGPMWRAKYFKT
ncbi:MAG: hypothetical protein R3B93_22760 [Bacteroidia bacterium]